MAQGAHELRHLGRDQKPSRATTTKTALVGKISEWTGAPGEVWTPTVILGNAGPLDEREGKDWDDLRSSAIWEGS